GAALWLNHAVVSWSISNAPPSADRVSAMRPYFADSAVAESPQAQPNPSPRASEETALQRIDRTGVLRIGYQPDNPPFVYRNDEGALVGFEVDLMHRLAVELEAALLLVPYDNASLDEAFAADHFDLAIGGLGSFVREAPQYRESEPYLELHAALVVPDYRVDDFESVAQLQSMDGLRLAYMEGGVLVRTGRHRIPGVEVIAIASDEEFLHGGDTHFDALLTTAETGAIITMVNPDYSVVIPDGFRVGVPVVVALTTDESLRRVVNRFIGIKQADGTIEALYEHWILGSSAADRKRRWSVAQDVLGWGR
ncbi:MAG: transporter substrate-binding domain-containing protein, partial [Deltaproteobacteria bacterium]|nr:transporter substrate-binding domain-containing protein [Deltaproteobacteria bacterium]